MKFFNIEIRNVTCYGIIYSTGAFEINFWDFNADDYNSIEGKATDARKAWKEISTFARNMDRINHTFNGNLEEPTIEELILDEEWEQAKAYSFFNTM